MKRNIFWVFSVIIFLAAGIYFFHKSNASQKKGLLANSAEKILADCSSVKERSSCYEKEIPKLMDSPVNFTLEETFAVTKLVQEKDNQFLYCHLLGHELGAKEVAKDPSKWKDTLMRCPIGECVFGCQHGVLMEKFKDERLTESNKKNIMSDLSSICEARGNWQPTKYTKSQCYHAVGHALMAVTDNNLNKSLSLCDETAKDITQNKDFTHVCYAGVFMQIFQPIEMNGSMGMVMKMNVSILQKKEELKDFCGQFKDKEKEASCWDESWPLFGDEISQPEGIIHFCSNISDPAGQSQCMVESYRLMAKFFSYDSEKIKTFCAGFPQDQITGCFSETAANMLTVDANLEKKAVDLCTYAEIYGQPVKNSCYQKLSDYVTNVFHYRTSEFVNLCSALPNPFKDNCFEGKNNALDTIYIDRAKWVRLMDKLGPDEAYKVLLDEYGPQPREQHLEAHIFGEELYKKLGLKGITVCDESFDYGCFHGLIITAINQNGIGIISQLDKTCQAKFGDLSGCQHGIGHGILEYLGFGKLLEALNTCRTLVSDHYVEACNKGVFMEYDFPVTNNVEAIQIRKFDPDNPYLPCSQMPEQFASDCYFELPHYWRQIFYNDFNKVGELCHNLLNETNKKACYDGYINTARGFQQTRQVQNDPCSNILDGDVKNRCYSEIHP